MDILTINTKDFDLTHTDAKTIDLIMNNHAYSSHAESEPHETEYLGSATDADGNAYTVSWRLLDDFNPRTDDDESHACDWDNPRTVTLND